MSEPRFGGVLDVQDSTVFTSDRFTFTLLLNGFDLPRSQPSAVNPNSNTRKIVIAVEPLSAPTTVAGVLRGNWEAAPEDDVEHHRPARRPLHARGF